MEVQAQPVTKRRLLRAYFDIVKDIDAREDKYADMSDEELKAVTETLKARIKKACAGAQSEAAADRAMKRALDDVLPDAFAVVREAADRVLGKRHFAVQLVGGLCLHDGNVAEMRTGEGKTLVATLPAYLNALSGTPVHVVTVNEYLAKRDAKEMGKVFAALGLTCDYVVDSFNPQRKRQAYACDIVYMTASQLCFDYLRDRSDLEAVYGVTLNARPLGMAIVDEADSVLLDQASIPCILSNPAVPSEEAIERWQQVTMVARQLKGEKVKNSVAAKDLPPDTDFYVVERDQTVGLTPQGVERCEDMLGITRGRLFERIDGTGNDDDDDDPAIPVETWSTYLLASLKAQKLYIKGRDYIIMDEDGEGHAMLVDQNTGRVLPRTRLMQSMHQALEAKEGLKIGSSSEVIAQVTYQTYFGYYKQLSGMTGTALPAEREFESVYKLPVIPVPPNRPRRRVDEPPELFREYMPEYDGFLPPIAKYTRSEVQDLQGKKLPVLIGTASINQSYAIAQALQDCAECKVLNASPENVAKEAEIIAQAGRASAVTIATSIAGRGTDILLGGNAAGLAERTVFGVIDSLLTTTREDALKIMSHWKSSADRDDVVRFTLLKDATSRDIADWEPQLLVRHADIAEDPSYYQEIGVNATELVRLREQQDRCQSEFDNVLPYATQALSDLLAKASLLGTGLRDMEARRGLLLIDAPDTLKDDVRDLWAETQRRVSVLRRQRHTRVVRRRGSIDRMYAGFDTWQALLDKKRARLIWGNEKHPWDALPERALDVQRERSPGVEPSETYAQMVSAAVKALGAMELLYDAVCGFEKAYIVSKGGLTVINVGMQPNLRSTQQLLGRCARQGDPGRTMQWVSADDPDLLLYAAEDILVVKAFMPKTVIIEEYNLLTGNEKARKIIHSAQERYEGRDEASRRNSIKYDRILEVFRQQHFGLRLSLTSGTKEQVHSFVHACIQYYVDTAVGNTCSPSRPPSEWDAEALSSALAALTEADPKHDIICGEPVFECGGYFRHVAKRSRAGAVSLLTECLALSPAGLRGVFWRVARNEELAIPAGSFATRTPVGYEWLMKRRALVRPHDVVWAGAGAKTAPRVAASKDAKGLAGAPTFARPPVPVGRYAAEVRALRDWLGEICCILMIQRLGILTLFCEYMPLKSEMLQRAVEELEEAWKVVLAHSDSTRAASGLRSFGNLKPLDEYNVAMAEAFESVTRAAYNRIAVSCMTMGVRAEYSVLRALPDEKELKRAENMREVARADEELRQKLAREVEEAEKAEKAAEAAEGLEFAYNLQPTGPDGKPMNVNYVRFFLRMFRAKEKSDGSQDLLRLARDANVEIDQLRADLRAYKEFYERRGGAGTAAPDAADIPDDVPVLSDDDLVRPRPSGQVYVTGQGYMDAETMARATSLEQGPAEQGSDATDEEDGEQGTDRPDVLGDGDDAAGGNVNGSGKQRRWKPNVYDGQG
ncbi:unnamed protein product [Pedinophyceae sp. YPF-701]|nr:unnamed protein product [Pedinophyceae sp. YPF-701]